MASAGSVASSDAAEPPSVAALPSVAASPPATTGAPAAAASPLFSIRTAQQRDLAFLQLLCDEQGLAIIQSVADCRVAVNDEDEPVGFIHIETVDDETVEKNGAYVYPVAVFESWQHYGVASALIEDAYSRVDALKLVACRPSQGFYPKAGFKPVGWELIAQRITRDCELCVAREACQPIPFMLG